MAVLWRLSAVCGALGGRGEGSSHPEVLSVASSQGRGWK
uniref:Succinate dehydrogenase complex subunit D n=1 Tax=Homo sapiens TaxID=9606 RepID=A0AAQ5BHI1_HUMAN